MVFAGPLALQSFKRTWAGFNDAIYFELQSLIVVDEPSLAVHWGEICSYFES